MRDCSVFEGQLLGGIPYRSRYSVENALRSFQASNVMLHVYSEAVLSAKPPQLDGRPPTVIAFGSFGRMDGAPSVSDYDVLFLYQGPVSTTHSEALRAFARRIVQSNRALPFDHRDEIEGGTFDFAKSPAYPILSTTELLAEPQGVRSLQVL